MVEMRAPAGGWSCLPGPRALLEEHEAAAYHACVLGLRDYVDKNGFPGVVLGLSGGIDCALCAAMAVDALGPERVHCVMLPYRYTSNESLADAADCAGALGVRYDIVPIAEPVEGFGKALAQDVHWTPARHHRGEHPVARARHDPDGDLQQVRRHGGDDRQQGEMSVGYATLYGDMNGGFNPDKGPLQDGGLSSVAAGATRMCPRAARARAGVVIPENILTRPPTAELRENQTDQDSLPPYEVLDDILGMPGRAGDAAQRDRRPRPSARDCEDASSACSTSPSTSAGRRRRA